MNESTSEIKLEHINPLLKDYEILIRTLTEQLNFYKEEQCHLKVEVVNLLEENKLLSTKIKQLLANADPSVSPDVSHKYSEGDYVENLKSQISYILKEKESALELWRNSLSTIDHLEEELKLYEGRSHGYVSKHDVKKIKDNYDKQIKDLHADLVKSKTSLVEAKNSSQTLLDAKSEELRRASEVNSNTLKVVQNLEAEISKLQKEHTDITGMRNELTRMIDEKNKVINDLRMKHCESRSKVNEAVQIVEVAIIEKDAAIVRENQTREELTKLSKALSDIIEDANERLKNELEIAKKLYYEKLEVVRNDMRELLDKIKVKDVELEKHISKTKILEEEVDRLRKGNLLMIDGNSTSNLLILEKNLESTFQKLLMSEKKNVQLVAEKEGIKENLEQMASQYERDMKCREKEKRMLESKISTLQNELEVSNHSIVQVASKVEEVNGKISMIEGEFRKQLHQKDVNTEKVLSDKIKEIEEANSRINNDLKYQLESQINFNRKWKIEVREVTNKLDRRVQELKKESSDLKKINKELNSKLFEAEKEVEVYKEYLKSLCLDVTNVATTSKEQIGDYKR